MPGNAKTVSVRIAPESSSPTWSPMIVVTGSIALRSTCRRSTALRREPLRARGAHVVLVLDVEHRGARDARDDRERDRAERDRGQDQVLDRVPGRVPVAA